VLPRPSARTVRRLALASVVANGAIVVTGGAVRLTASGLGCPTWPRCTDTTYTPTAEYAAHGLIEFGNRLLTFVLLAVVLASLVASWRSGRRDLRRPAVLVLLGIPAQAVLGGITVLTGLNPWTVAGHFLVSMVLVAVATVHWQRTREAEVAGRPLVPPALRTATRVLLVLTAVALVLGTVVTGSGPHSGDVAAGRTGLDTEVVSKVHAWSVWALVLGTGAALLAARRTPGATRLTRALTVLLAVELGQGLVGYVQYFTGLPVGLVAVHLVGSNLVVVAAVLAHLAGRDRSAVPSVESAQPLVAQPA
jgi:heme a synthase